MTRSLVGLASSYDNFMNSSNDVSWDMLCRILGLEIGGAWISSTCDCHFEYYLNRLGAGNQPQLLGWVARLARKPLPQYTQVYVLATRAPLDELVETALAFVGMQDGDVAMLLSVLSRGLESEKVYGRLVSSLT
ncbi:hypothetical protein N7536_000116 [Penicillium majusculum]|nr:hypothetical protein N7536_000116 [Penicillium majusculum]